MIPAMCFFLLFFATSFPRSLEFNDYEHPVTLHGALLLLHVWINQFYGTHV